MKTIPRDKKWFLKRVNKTAKCWLWTGPTMGRYGCAHKAGGGNENAHRMAWKLFKSAIPDGLQVCHKCDVPLCVRPSHLFLGTQSDNLRDMIKKRRWKKDPLKLSPTQIITLKEARIIKRLLKSKVRQCQLAKRFSLDRRTINDIAKGRTWKTA